MQEPLKYKTIYILKLISNIKVVHSASVSPVNSQINMIM